MLTANAIHLCQSLRLSSIHDLLLISFASSFIAPGNGSSASSAYAAISAFPAWIWSSTYRCTATGSKFPFPDNDFHQEDTDYPGQAALNRTRHNAVNSIPTGFWRLQQYWFLTMRARTIRTTEYTGCRNQPTGQAVSRQPCSWHITQHRLRLMSWTGRYQGDAIYGVGDCEQPQVRLMSWVLSAIRLEQ